MNRPSAGWIVCLLLCGMLIAGVFYLIGYKAAYDRMENTVPLPMARPSRMDVKKVISVNADPTAASAPVPMNRPTMRVSAIL